MPMTSATGNTGLGPAVGWREAAPPGLDGFTISHLQGLGIQAGWRCLHVDTEAEAITS
jgi:hypothetical protein